MTASSPLNSDQPTQSARHQNNQQVKQTQASLARQSHVQQQLQAASSSSQNDGPTSSSQSIQNTNNNVAQSSQQQKPAATFVDCLIRRFKNCFSEDHCTVPMFVVGNLSPGIDGTHLILPPCVSLGRQGINRFSSPKNLRLMNSIRESCRSIEELDLGGNKLADLIEVYKILQLTPNLKFLNLSENDLSRTAPVAMATSPNYSTLGAGASSYVLAPLNQNTSSLAARRHSTLGQSQLSGASRVAEARRLAAANALAQSKKTSSSMASKLAASSAAASTSRAAAKSSMSSSASASSSGRRLQPSSSQRRNQITSPTPAMSTMQLARSLSSLSAKDLRGTSAAAHHRANMRAGGSRRAAATSSALAQSTAATNTGSQVVNNSNNSTTTNTSFRRTFESIKALALNNTGCQWRVVCSILSRMPNLEELHLSLNNYEKIDLEPNEFKHHSLKRLYLCNNPKLTNWQELDKLLIAFPSLEALSIANCNISQIPDNLDRAREWRKLCGLNINGWPIKEWPVVERLNQLPSLIDLRCRNLEVLQSIDEPRHHLIARLPKLQRLNGSEIEEREEAEKAFVRFFMANSHLERPSRFHELIQIYGEISTVDVDVDLSPPSQAQVRIIYLNRSHYRKENNDDIMMSEDFLLKLMDNADSGSADSNFFVQQQNQEPVRLFKDEGQEIVALNVDLRQSVRKFKVNLASLFGLEGHSLILYYIDHEMVGLMGPELLKHNQKKLWNYNVQDGDQFIVEER